jgi:hypothetical protein
MIPFYVLLLNKRAQNSKLRCNQHGTACHACNSFAYCHGDRGRTNTKYMTDIYSILLPYRVAYIIMKRDAWSLVSQFFGDFNSRIKVQLVAKCTLFIWTI